MSLEIVEADHRKTWGVFSFDQTKKTEDVKIARRDGRKDVKILEERKQDLGAGKKDVKIDTQRD